MINDKIDNNLVRKELITKILLIFQAEEQTSET